MIRLNPFISRGCFYNYINSIRNPVGGVILYVHNSLCSLPAAAILVFGDSTVDSGNNNYIATPFKANFPPYGIDFPNHIPTGRFSDGRLVPDFLAHYTRVKDYVPPYLDPTLTVDDLATGVCFASAASGFDPLTAQISAVIPMQKQLEYFQDYKTKLENSIGEEKTKSLISNAAFFISAGSNDFMINYFGTTFRRQTYTLSNYEQLLLQNIQEFIQTLIDKGARLIGLVGLPPLGCSPAVISLNPGSAFGPRQCNESLSQIAIDFNQKLQSQLKAMQTDQGPTILYFDFYQSLTEMLQKPSQFGFDETNTGCCGSGLIEAGFACNVGSYVCPDPSKYVFFDSIHPTEATYNYVFKKMQPVIDEIIQGQ
ncbi:GDSL esterase/lipase [Abeliophyllum distichum]|uniref:GDSL esterase/lipase n=1 Tax=Abeliophyllum distichum TaxID=126358 RepID=A0ABD1QGE3_9LAMI